MWVCLFAKLFFLLLQLFQTLQWKDFSPIFWGIYVFTKILPPANRCILKLVDRANRSDTLLALTLPPSLNASQFLPKSRCCRLYLLPLQGKIIASPEHACINAIRDVFTRQNKTPISPKARGLDVFTVAGRVHLPQFFSFQCKLNTPGITSRQLLLPRSPKMRGDPFG